MNNSNSENRPLEADTEIRFSDKKIEASELSADKLSLEMTEKGDATVRRVLSAYNLGDKLRQLRLKKKIGLVDLGKHTGLSASMLSQLENGKLIPTLPTLARIALVFDVCVDYFFGDSRRRRPFSIVRAAERIKFPDRPDSPCPSFFFECLAFSSQDKSIQAYLAEFPQRNPGEATEHYHDGAEFLHVLEGELEICYQDAPHVLKAGDSVYFDSAEAHSYRGLSEGPARVVVITTPAR